MGCVRGCMSDDRKGVFAACSPAGMRRKVSWVQGLPYNVDGWDGKRWKAELHGRREMDGGTMWEGGLS